MNRKSGLVTILFVLLVLAGGVASSLLTCSFTGGSTTTAHITVSNQTSSIVCDLKDTSFLVKTKLPVFSVSATNIELRGFATDSGSTMAGMASNAVAPIIHGVTP